MVLYQHTLFDNRTEGTEPALYPRREPLGMRERSEGRRRRSGAQAADGTPEERDRRPPDATEHRTDQPMAATPGAPTTQRRARPEYHERRQPAHAEHHRGQRGRRLPLRRPGNPARQVLTGVRGNPVRRPDVPGTRGYHPYGGGNQAYLRGPDPDRE